MPSRSPSVNTFAQAPPLTSMQFNVGPWVWTVRLARGILLNGDPCYGKADHTHRRILICADMPPARRLQVLLHELRHAWQWEVPKPKDAEEECDLFATASAAAWADLEAQGGIPSLLRMELDHRVSDGELLQRWYGYADALAHPDVELTADEYAPIAETFDELRRRGHQFDPTFRSLMHVLHRQMADAAPAAEIGGEHAPA